MGSYRNSGKAQAARQALPFRKQGEGKPFPLPGGWTANQLETKDTGFSFEVLYGTPPADYYAAFRIVPFFFPFLPVLPC